MRYFLGSLLLYASVTICVGQLTFEPFATNIVGPVDITHAGDGSKRVFVVKKVGEIIAFDATGQELGIYLDIKSKVGNSGGERGLLGLAFHPDYANNGYFFINYTSTIGEERTVVERYQADPPSSNNVTSSGVTVLSFTQPNGNHNGGDLAFSPVDGYLYIPTGDGGSANDPMERAQDLTSPHGKILRIDVNHFDDTLPYRIPPDNPFGTSLYTAEFVDTVDEQWAWGLRNPWRFCFSNEGDLWIGDVGQDNWEEVNFVSAADHLPGLNYGWDCKEGNADCPTCDPGNCEGNTYIDPIHQYDLSRQSITGGEVLEGPHYPSFPGAYLFAEYVHDQMWTLTTEVSGAESNVRISELENPPTSVSSFGKDEDGRVYAASLGSNAIYRIVDLGASPFELVEVVINRFEKTNLLEWKTSNEINALHFVVERRRDPGDFVQIGIVPVPLRENKSGTINYRFPDVIGQPGHYFYRIKSIDQDGAYRYSTMLDVKVGELVDLLLTPNPANSIVTVTLPNFIESGELTLTDLGGKQLYRIRIQPDDLLRAIPIEVSQFNPGLVMVRFSASSRDYTKKLMLYR